MDLDEPGVFPVVFDMSKTTVVNLGGPGRGAFFFFFVIRHSFTIEDLVSAPNLKLGCAVILRGCASDYK